MPDSSVQPPTIRALGFGAKLVHRGVTAAPNAPDLLASECLGCGAQAWPPLPRCAACWSDVREVPLPRVGTLYSFTIVHAAPPPWQTPYAVGYVDLPGGVRVFAHLRGTSDALVVDGPVRAVFGSPTENPPYWFEPMGLPS